MNIISVQFWLPSVSSINNKEINTKFSPKSNHYNPPIWCTIANRYIYIICIRTSLLDQDTSDDAAMYACNLRNKQNVENMREA